MCLFEESIEEKRSLLHAGKGKEKIKKEACALQRLTGTDRAQTWSRMPEAPMLVRSVAG